MKRENGSRRGILYRGGNQILIQVGGLVDPSPGGNLTVIGGKGARCPGEGNQVARVNGARLVVAARSASSRSRRVEDPSRMEELWEANLEIVRSSSPLLYQHLLHHHSRCSQSFNTFAGGIVFS